MLIRDLLGAESRCGATFVDKAFLEWLQPKLVGVRLFPEDVATGGHIVFDPLTHLLLERFQTIKETFDDRDSAQLQLPNEYRDAEGNNRSIEVAEGYENTIIDRNVHLSR